MAIRRKPIDVIVRRGALRRFHKLKQKTAELPVIVSWDRRKNDRRSAAEAPSGSRRRKERRQKPPFTWELSDFVIAIKAPRRTKKVG
jgi:hypothetical protein